MIKRILYTLLIMFPVVASAQINTDRVMAIGRNALYFEDYVLSIQYFNQVINAKPYLSDPYFYRGLAKINLDDLQSPETAEHLCSKCVPYANAWKPYADKIWSETPVKKSSYENYGHC